MEVSSPQKLVNSTNKGFCCCLFLLFFLSFFPLFHLLLLLFLPLLPLLYWDDWFIITPLPRPQGSYKTSSGLSFVLCKLLPHSQEACLAQLQEMPSIGSLSELPSGTGQCTAHRVVVRIKWLVDTCTCTSTKLSTD